MFRAMGGPNRRKVLAFGRTVRVPAVDKWKPAVWLVERDLTENHLVRTDDGIVRPRCVRRFNEQRWSEVNFRANRRDTTEAVVDDVLPPAESSAPEGTVTEDTATGPFEEEDLEMQGKTLKKRQASNSHKSEKRGEAREDTHVKKKPVKRRLME